MPISDLKYHKIKGGLSIEFESYPVDLLASGIINLHVHRIINKVAFETLPSDAVSLAREFYYRQAFQRYREPILIEAEVTKTETGSSIQEIALGVVMVLSDPHTQAILENLAANEIWAFGRHVSRIAHKDVQGRPPQPSSRSINVGRDISIMISRLSDRGKPCRLSITQKSGHSSCTVTFEIPPGR